jgi:hypothetical protein
VLGRIFRGLRRLFVAKPTRWAMVVLVVVWVAGAALAMRAETTYKSEAIVAFTPRDPVATGAETMVLVMPKYVEVLRSPAVVDRAAEQLDASASWVRASSAGVVQPNTLNLVVRTTSADPEVGERLAQVLAAGVIDSAGSDPLVRAELVAPPVAGSEPAPPTPEELRLLAVVLGLIAAGVTGAGVARRGGAWERLRRVVEPELGTARRG